MAAPRISHDGFLIVPPTGSRFADFPRDLRWLGALACLGSAAFVGSAITLAVRFVAVL